MPETNRDLSILFKELECSFDEQEEELSGDVKEENKEYEEIRILGDIVREIEEPPQNYFSTT